VDGEPAELDRSASDLQDEVVQELGDRRWTVEANDLKNTVSLVNNRNEIIACQPLSVSLSMCWAFVSNTKFERLFSSLLRFHIAKLVS
jgi:hypothetical protein